MQIKCPYNCSIIDLKTGTCQKGHQFSFEHGVLKLLTEDFKETLTPFLKKFTKTKFLENRTIQDISIYNDLPFHFSVKNDPAWKERNKDYKVIMGLLRSKSNKNVLEIGPWNGWLTNQMVKEGHNVLAIDYFIDPPNGLAAKQYYRNEWYAVQMNLEQPEILIGPFDMIILNRNFAGFTNPVTTLRILKNSLSKEGIIVATGLTFNRNVASALKTHQTMMNDFKNENGFDMFFKKLKGFFDMDDLRIFEKEGMEFHPYKTSIIKKTALRILGKDTQYCYGIHYA